MHFQKVSLPAVLMMASASKAHVVLETPKPFKFVAYGPTNPISPSGEDFPCKIPPGGQYIVDGERTKMAIGEEQTMTFAGQAVHGGGSCQIAISLDKEPTKDSSWYVIHSIEGGCPARNQKGNLEGPNVDSYAFTIPEGIPPGEVTLAWSWLARIGGSGEFYMNCAPITVTEGVKRRKTLAERRTSMFKRLDFPELFMADIGELSGGCTTDEALRQQIPIAYPNPGSSVDRPEGNNLFQQPCDGNPRAKGPNKAILPEPSASTSTPTASTIPSDVVSSVFSSPTVSAQPIPTSSEVALPQPTEGSGATCTEGHLTCLEDAAHFATCTGGQLTPPQQIAPGFKCRPGSGVGLDISPM